MTNNSSLPASTESLITERFGRSSAEKRALVVKIFIILIVVIVLLGLIISAQYWYTHRGGTAPEDLRITVSSTSGASEDIAPFQACEIGTEDCAEHAVGDFYIRSDETLTISVPREIAYSDWSLLRIYDDPQANDQQFFAASAHTSSVDVKGSTDIDVQENEDTSTTETSAQLLLVEISAVVLGKDAQGEDTPYDVTFSVNTHEAALGADAKQTEQ